MKIAKRLISLVLSLVIAASCFVMSASAEGVDVKNSVSVSGKLTPTNNTLSLDYVVTEGIDEVTGVQVEIEMPEGFAISEIAISSELAGKWEIKPNADNTKLLTMNTLAGVAEGDANNYSLDEIATLKDDKYNIATLYVTVPTTVVIGEYTAKVKVIDVTDGEVANTGDVQVDNKFTYCTHTNTSVRNKKTATCTKTGYTGDTYCNDCNELLKKGTATALAKHQYTKITSKNATLGANGYKLTECKVCGKDYSKTYYYYPKTVKLSTTTYTYNGKVKKPSVKVTGSNGKTISSSNYTVSYASGRKYPGKYKVTVKFKGNYSGTKYVYFQIKPKKVSLSSVKSTSKKKMTVKWSKQSKVSGYQVVYATNSKFTKSKKTVTVKGSSSKSKTIKSLKSKKTYYVKVRSYKTIDGKKVYGSYSKVKKVKVK